MAKMFHIIMMRRWSLITTMIMIRVVVIVVFIKFNDNDDDEMKTLVVMMRLEQ